MHRLTRRSVSAILRTGGGARYRNSAAPISCSVPIFDSVGESESRSRWYSVLLPKRSDTIKSLNQVQHLNFLGKRYESTSAASDASATPPAERYEYQAEVSRLMDLIVNSLYSNKEVFLRELISNASDALDKLRFLSVTQPDLLKGAVDLDIRIQTDKENGIVTITDTGIGMTQQELVDCLGTIAQSGTAKFLKALKDSKEVGGDNNLIGQFGVGFYSAFLVCDRVVVSTKSPKSDKQYVWEGEANASSYTIREETDPEKLLPRGTRLTLHLKRDDKGFAHPERIQKLVKNYSQFVSFPIYTWQEKGFTKEVEVDEDPAETKKDGQNEQSEKKKKTKTVVEKYWDWELTNETQPIWLRNPKEVTTEEYNEFYKKTFNEYLDPLASSHFTTEGEVEFRSILYVPAIAPMGKDDIVNPKTKNIRLYVKRVFISDDFDGELFPRYLSFVKGVVDSNDLPLNVSREILQESRIVRIMRKRLVRKAFDMILGISMSENKDDYDRFWENFGKHLKLGCIEDRENHKRIAPLLRFLSSQSVDELISLDEYVENMKPEQKDIYYMAADSVTSARNTPFLERLLEKDLEVLFLVDPIDEVAIQNLKAYKEKNEEEMNRRKEDDPEEAAAKESLSIEQIFASKEVPPWQKQVTIRALVVSFVLSILFTFIVMKLNLTTGIIPSLNVSAGLLGFFFIKTWTKLVEKSGMLKQPFTRQENTVIQTCVVASSGIAFSGGFGSYLFGMSEVVAKQSSEATSAKDIKNPALGWIIGFIFVVSFLGLFSVVPLRKIMIIDFKLTYPSGTATAHLINSFHTPQGAKLAKKQVRALGKFFSFSFLWGFFQWFFTAGDDCGFVSFPTFGLKAYENKFYFDFSATYVGVGMICPYLINISLLVGAILSWGIMWPLIDNKKGSWYSADLSPSSLHGLQGYKVFIAIAMILGDGLYNFLKVLSRTLLGLYKQLHKKDSGVVIPVAGNSSPQNTPSESYDDQIRTQLFLKDQIPLWLAIVGYVTIAIISAATLPHIFHQLKWYYIVVIYIIAPPLAFCNAYGCGLTDWSLASTYGKLAIFTIGAWAGASQGGVLAGLAACGVMMNIVSTASDLMQDFKTGYMTLASPRSMFVSQIIGTAMGCIISPCVFWLFYKAFSGLGTPDSEYPAPYALVYRNMSILGVQGFSALPKHCLTLCYVFFIAAIVINGIRDAVGKKRASYIPLPMAMAIPFYLGSYFAIDMCVGSFILFVWRKLNKAKADAFGPAVASGLICGDGIWTLPSSILALAGVNPPICMKFLSRGTNVKVDGFLAS